MGTGQLCCCSVWVKNPCRHSKNTEIHRFRPLVRNLILLNSSSSSSLFVQIKIHDANKEHMIKPAGQQGGKKHTYCCVLPLNRTRKKFCINNTLQNYKYNGKKYNSNKNNNGSVKMLLFFAVLYRIAVMHFIFGLLTFLICFCNVTFFPFLCKCKFLRQKILIQIVRKQAEVRNWL